jgi:hypothetical protein
VLYYKLTDVSEERAVSILSCLEETLYLSEEDPAYILGAENLNGTFLRNVGQ